MAQAQSVRYSVLTPQGDGWSVRGETGDMGAALNTARSLLSNRQAARVRVVKAFLDSTTGRNVTTTIFDEKSGAPAAASGGHGAVYWLAVAVAMFAIGFGAVFAFKTFLL